MKPYSLASWEIYLEQNLKNVPDVIGVFQLSKSLYDESKITYIGSGLLQTEMNRLLDVPCTKTSSFCRYEIVKNEQQATERKQDLLQNFKETYGHLPECNESIDEK